MNQSHSGDYEYGGPRGGHAKPCRACTDFKSWYQTNKTNSTLNDKSVLKTNNNSSSIHSKECPLDKDELGRNSWSLFHTMAAYYPEKPSNEDKVVMNNFIQAIARFYPCESCAIDFRRDIKDDPPEMNSRVKLSYWWCRIHNKVNRKLGKPEFDCSKIDERWLDGWKDGSCG